MRSSRLLETIGGLSPALGRRLGAARQPTAPDQPGLEALATLEAAGVTFLGVARQRGEAGGLGFGEGAVSFLRAAQCQDEAHYHFLLSAGAAPRAAAFVLPEGALDDPQAVLRTLVGLEAIGVAAHMALARRAAEAGDHRLVEVAYQMGAVDAQHEALARVLTGGRPPNDRAFARWRFADPAEAAEALAELGFGKDGEETIPFPGPVDRLCAGVVGLVPETTDDPQPSGQ